MSKRKPTHRSVTSSRARQIGKARVGLYLDASVLARADAQARAEGTSRNDLFNRAVASYCDSRGG